MAKLRNRTGSVYNTLSAKDGTVEYYIDCRGFFRWRVVADNGRVLTHSSESYKDKLDAERGYATTRVIVQKAR